MTTREWFKRNDQAYIQLYWQGSRAGDVTVEELYQIFAARLTEQFDDLLAENAALKEELKW